MTRGYGLPASGHWCRRSQPLAGRFARVSAVSSMKERSYDHAADTIMNQVHAALHAGLVCLGLAGWEHVVSMWLFFAGCGVLQLLLSYAICRPLERYLPLVRWPGYKPPVADIVYAFFVRIVLFPLIAYFEYDFLRASLAGALTSHGLTPPSLPGLVGSPVLAFLLGFVALDLTDYCRHRLAHRFGWFYGVHSLHHAEDHMTFWSDDRNHLLEDAITYVMLMAGGLAIGVPSIQFPLVILGFRLIGSVAHANTSVDYGWFGQRLIISPQFHRAHHALKSAGRGSFNLGTSFPWWDMAFGTADFAALSLETGDAGAEPALVSGSWGAQQLAGLRRMWRLARARKRRPAAARETS